MQQQAVQEIASAGDVLHSDDGIEWYLFDADGELIEVFWLEDAADWSGNGQSATFL